MTPTPGGRHCAACQKTVVDFTLKTDAEILAYFNQAGAAVPCGHFRASQLGRTLQPAVPAARPASRWRGWLAAGLAVWNLRAEATDAPLVASAPPRTQHPHRQPGPLPPTRQVAGRIVRGVVHEAQRQAPLAQAKVRLRGTRRVATTDAHGYFQLWVPARRGPHRSQVLVVQRLGFATKAVRVPLTGRAARALHISLPYDVHGEVSDFSSVDRGLSGAPMMLVEEAVEISPANAGKADTVILPTQVAPLKWYQRFKRPFRLKSSR